MEYEVVQQLRYVELYIVSLNIFKVGAEPTFVEIRVHLFFLI